MEVIRCCFADRTVTNKIKYKAICGMAISSEIKSIDFKKDDPYLRA